MHKVMAFESFVTASWEWPWCFQDHSDSSEAHVKTSDGVAIANVAKYSMGDLPSEKSLVEPTLSGVILCEFFHVCVWSISLSHCLQVYIWHTHRTTFPLSP